MDYQVVGKSISRADAREKVTGTALYINDLIFPRTLFLKVLRAGVPHAIIKSIDTSRAESMEGVFKVITSKTDGFNRELLYGTCIFDQPPIAVDKVRHGGEPVAAVVAESEKIALEALKEISVEYKALPFVLDAMEAISSEAPLIHERNGHYKHIPTFVPIPKSNVFYKYHLKKGNWEDVFQEADIIVEDEYEYPLLNHAALEPHGAVAYWDQSGDLHIWSSSQAPFILREVLADMFNLPMNKIHINIPSYIGGGFGGKSDYTIEPLLATVAQFLPGYHIKFVLSREEVFTGTVLGRGMKGRMKIGIKKDGTFTGIDVTQYYSDGAYGDTSCNVVLAGGHNCVGPYYFKNCNIKSFGVYTNTPPVGAYRGYGHPEGQFMVERLIEKIALQIGVDSREIRIKNFLRPGDTNSLGQTITKHNGSIHECFQKMMSVLDSNILDKEDEKYLYGRGVAALVKSPVQAANASSNVFLKINEDLTVNISIGGIEMGQGCLTVLAQIAAETLMFPIKRIRINYEVNSQLSPYEWQTVASMTTMRVGNAIVSACEGAIYKFKENANKVFGCAIEDLKYDGKSIIKGNQKINLSKLVLGYQHEDGHAVGDPILSTGSAVVRNVTFPDIETGQYQPYEWTFGSQGCDIQIEKETGKIKILHFVTALDVGKVINPETAKGQIYGGVTQGIGAALKEKILFNEEGIMKTTNLRRYQIPTLADIPEKFSCIFIENPQPNGPYGARPMAEHPVIGPPPAILNAFQNATGVSLTKLPATPDKILDALKQKRQI
ncbi:MAG: xanthine dehydrogenase family protein molybdopterin-binding subunit [Candidatus Hodarchaeota archaeon]